MSDETPDKPAYKLVKPRATGKEREDAAARLHAVTTSVSERVAKLGLSEEEIAAELAADE